MGLKSFFGKKSKTKKRLSPSVAAARNHGTTSAEVLAQSHPMYQYALNEYAQTMAPMTSNDDGMSAFSGPGARRQDEERGSTFTIPKPQSPLRQGNTRINVGGSPSSTSQPSSDKYMRFTSSPQQGKHDDSYSGLPLDEPTIVDATYDETYGDAYIGQPIRYVYPSGYQSMRPRGGPWKLSIFVCVSFTWLSVFIIGHCADQYGDVQYDMDDDTMVIETRWCGSRMLYLMWLTSMLITGISCAYMGVIGYIKVRDFAVANGRSQPPGMTDKSDYYVKIGDGQLNQKTIYQADGTPQFWGAHIYRPSQAAVAVTSR